MGVMRIKLTRIHKISCKNLEETGYLGDPEVNGRLQKRTYVNGTWEFELD